MDQSFELVNKTSVFMTVVQVVNDVSSFAGHSGKKFLRRILIVFVGLLLGARMKVVVLVQKTYSSNHARLAY